MSTLNKKFIGLDQVGADQIRIENDSFLRARNAADTADINILKVNDQNLVELGNLAAPVNDADAANKKFVEDADAVLQNAIDALTSGLTWKAPAFIATGDADLKEAANGTELSTLLPFSDDEGTPIVIGDFQGGELILSVDGATTKIFQVYDDESVLKITDADVTQLVPGDVLLVENDLTATPDAQETSAIYTFNGSAMLKIGSVNWSVATGINLSSGFAPTVGTVTAGDTVEAAIQKIVGSLDNASTNLLNRFGSVAMNNASTLSWRNAADDASISVMRVTDEDKLFIGNQANDTMLGGNNTIINGETSVGISSENVSLSAEEFISFGKLNGDAASLLFHSNEGAANLTLSVPNDLADYRGIVLPGEAPTEGYLVQTDASGAWSYLDPASITPDLSDYLKKDGSVALEGHLAPDADNTYNLGADDARFSMVFANNLSSGAGDMSILTDEYIHLTATAEEASAKLMFHDGDYNLVLGVPTLADNRGIMLPGAAPVEGHLVQTDAGGQWSYVDPAELSGPEMTYVATGAAVSINLVSAAAQIDMITLTNGDLVLVTNQSAGLGGAAASGVYVFNGVGQPMTRAEGWDSAEDFVYGRQVYVQDGQSTGRKTYMVTSTVETLDTDPITFAAVAFDPDYVTGINALTPRQTGFSSIGTPSNYFSGVYTQRLHGGIVGNAVSFGYMTPAESPTSALANGIRATASSYPLVITHTANKILLEATEIDVNSNKITNLADPETDQEAATKFYVDDQLAGLVVPQMKVQQITLSGTDITNQSFQLAEEALAGTIMVIPAGGIPQLEGTDWEQDGNAADQINLKVGGSIATGGAAELVASDVVIVLYMHL